MKRTYADLAGNEYWVSEAVGGGAPFRTFKQKPRAIYPMRVESRFLPDRQNPDRAQADLDKYAAGCQMRVVV